jgi:hypothetical protein
MLFVYARIVSVKTLLKSLIVWLMLLAIPFQGFASATMLVCAPMQSAALVNSIAGVPAMTHDHQAMLAGERAEHDHHAANIHAKADQTNPNDESSSSHHAGGKCNSCATCCFGASMAPSHASRIPVETQQFSTIPFDNGFVPTVDLAFPERPPQASLT